MISQPFAIQEPFRLGLGLAALVFYLWVIHSYTLNAGDIAVIILGISILVRGGSMRLPMYLAMFGVFIAWCAIGLAVTTNIGISTEALVDLVKLWVISFFILNVVRTAGELRFLTIVWLAIFALYPVRGALYNHFICNCTEYGRVAWNFVFSNPNDLAALCLMPMAVCAGVAVTERVKIYRYASMIGIGVLALIVLLTQSRGAILGLGVAVILVPLASRRRARDFALIVLFMGGAALLAPKGVWDRLAGLANVSVESGMQGVDVEGSAESRWKVWGVAAGQVRDHPLTGVGLGMMSEVHRQVAMREGMAWSVRGQRDTHSTYLRIAAETGIPGLLIYLVMWGLALRGLSRAKAATRYVRPREHQFLTFITLGVIAFLGASVFGTYGTMSFTFIALAYVWLASELLSRHPWYAPPRHATTPGAADSAPRRGAPAPPASR